MINSQYSLKAIFTALIIAVSVIPIVVGTSVGLFIMQRMMIENVMYQRANQAQDIVERIDDISEGFVANVKIAASTLANHLETNQSQKQLVESLDKYFKNDEHLISLCLYGVDGEFRYRLDGHLGNTRKIDCPKKSHTVPFVSSAWSDRRQLSASTTLQADDGSYHYVRFNVPIGTSNNQQGNLVAKYDIKPVISEFERKIEQTDLHSFLIGPQGTLFSNAPDNAHETGTTITDLPIVSSLKNNLKWNQLTPYTGLSNTSVYGIGTPLELPGWHMVTEISRAAVLQPIYAQLSQLVLLSLLLITVSVLVGVRVAKRFDRYSHKLNTALDTLGNENYEIPSLVSKVKEMSNIGEGVAKLARALESSAEEKKHDIIQLRDATQNLETANQHLLRQQKLYRVLIEVNEQIIKAKNPDELIKSVCATVHDFGGIIMIWAAWADYEHDSLNYIHHEGSADFDPPVIIPTMSLRPEHFYGDTLIAKCVRHNTLQWSDDLITGQKTSEMQDMTKQFGIKATIAVPFRRSGHPVGALVMYSDQAGYFTSDIRELVAELSDEISFALDKFEEEAQLTEANRVIDESEQRYQALVEATGVGFVIVSEDGRVEFANEAYLNIVGYDSLEDIIGRTSRDWMAENEFEKRDSQFEKTTINNEKTITCTEYRRVNDGTIVPVEVTASAVDTANGRHLFALCRDITERVAAEKALAASESSLSTTLRSIGDAVIATDTDGLVVRMNTVAERLTSWSESEAIGSPLQVVFKLIDASSGQPVQDPISAMLSSGAPLNSRTQAVLIDKLGRKYQIENNSAPIRDNSGNISGVVVVFRDVTEERSQQQLLIDSEKRLRTVWEQIPGVAIHVCDRAGRIVVWNDASERLYGYSKDEAIGRSFIELVIPADQSESAQQIYEHLLAGDICVPASEALYRQKNGQTVAVFAHNVVIANAQGDPEIIGVDLDLGPIMLAKAAETRATEFLHAFVKAIPDIAFVRDETGRYVESFGRNGARIDLDLETFKGKTVQEILPDDVAKGVCDTITRTLERNKPQIFRYEISGKKGIRTYEAHTAPMPARPEQSLREVIWIARDVTEQVFNEEQLRQKQKMESIGQLAGGVAHDFNNQLMCILGYAELIESEAEEPNLKHYADIIVNSASRSADLTGQLLAFSRKGKYRELPVHTHELIEEVITLLNRSIDKNISFSMNFNAENDAVVGDISLLQNALLNLGLNARDAMPNGGQLIFETSNCVLGRDACDASGFDASPGEFVLLEVRDQGTGMDPATIDRIFEPFFTTKLAGDGTGMGLAAVYGTVQSHHGLIRVESELDVGTSMKIYLPTHLAIKPFVKYDTDDSTSGQQQFVLVVDDEESVREITRLMLEDCGFTVYSCDSGASAVNYYRKNADKVDVVLLDLIMPEMSGEQTYAQLRQINPSVTVIIASGYADDATTQNLIESGVAGFLLKPYTRVELVKKIQNIVAVT